MRWASAVSTHKDLDAALAAVAASVRSELEEQSPDFALVFVSPHFASVYEALPARLAAHLPARTRLGCSAGGVIGGGRELEQQPALALIAASLPGVTLHPVALEAEALPDADAPPRAWHQALGVAPQPAAHFILLADPFTFPVERLLAGLDYAYADGAKIGGLASGADGPGGNVLLLGAEARRSGAVGVALAGDIAVDTVVAQGCRPIGRTLQITRCNEHILFELDGVPALQVLQEIAAVAPERDRELMGQALFLGLAMDELAPTLGAGDFLIRNVLGIDPRHGALAIGAHLRQGQSVQFHVRDARTSEDDLQLVLERFAGRPEAQDAVGALLFSCLGRGIHLYGEPDHDSAVFRRLLGGLPLGGFFCNGEIGPVGGRTHVHGFTSSFGIFRPATGKSGSNR
ncbi:MAG TPA: FIST N-terminal domain-containing protein [Candidatus Krumholzibacteria bacterium]|nr:FIST N-terminal domain-containing protein [Candidatus Krumholzibacteria bacterium]